MIPQDKINLEAGGRTPAAERFPRLLIRTTRELVHEIGFERLAVFRRARPERSPLERRRADRADEGSRPVRKVALSPSSSIILTNDDNDVKHFIGGAEHLEPAASSILAARRSVMNSFRIPSRLFQFRFQILKNSLGIVAIAGIRYVFFMKWHLHSMHNLYTICASRGSPRKSNH